MKKYDFTIWNSEREKGYVFNIHGYYFWTVMLAVNVFVSLVIFSDIFEDLDHVLIATTVTETAVFIKYLCARKLMLEFYRKGIDMNKHEKKKYLFNDELGDDIDFTK